MLRLFVSYRADGETFHVVGSVQKRLQKLMGPSVIICSYTEDRWNDLIAAVDSVHRQTTPAHDVVVVVDHNDSLLERARSGLTEVVVIANRDARGLVGARNTGLTVARGDIVAFLDDDAVADRDWLERLGLAYDHATAGVGGAIVPAWDARRPAWFPEEFDWVVGCTYRGLPETRTEVRNLIGANMSFRREVLDELGGFRIGLGRIAARPVGCEETELCLRIRERWPEKRILFEPAARVVHRVPQERAKWSYFVARCRGEGISKAVLARRLSSRGTLKTERHYLRRTLPRAVTRSARELLNGDIGGLGRIGAVASGVVAALFGYAAGRLLRFETAAGRRGP